jgi:hypothetical protein
MWFSFLRHAALRWPLMSLGRSQHQIFDIGLRAEFQGRRQPDYTNEAGKDWIVSGAGRTA